MAMPHAVSPAHDQDNLIMVPFGADFPEIREGVRAICRRYPDKYWRDLEDTDEYAEEFVAELSKAGYLGALIPEDYGGAGLPIRAGCVILEEIHSTGCSAAACHAQMYMMGTLLRHGSEEQKRRYLPGIADGSIRFQAFGVTEPTTGSDTTQIKTHAKRQGDHYVVNGQKVWTSRAHKSDLMLLLVRTTPAGEVKKRSEGLSVLLVEMRDAIGKGLTLRRLDTMVNHQTNEVFFDNLEVPAANLIGQQDQGFRYILDGMNAERILGFRQVARRRALFRRAGVELFEGARRVRPSHRPEPGDPVSDCARLRRVEGRRPGDARGRRAVRRREALRRGGEHGEAARLRGRLACGGSLHADLRRLCGCARIRHRAQMA